MRRARRGAKGEAKDEAEGDSEGDAEGAGRPTAQGRVAKVSQGDVNYRLWGRGDGSRPLVVTIHGLCVLFEGGGRAGRGRSKSCVVDRRSLSVAHGLGGGRSKG